MNTSVVQGLERQLEDAQALIARREMALRLSNNRDFKKLIIEGFLEKDCAAFTHESTDPALTADQRAMALQSAQAAGALKRFLHYAFQMGHHASNQLPELEEALAEARASEDQDSDAVNLPEETHGDLA
jgi:hypothetical protein